MINSDQHARDLKIFSDPVTDFEVTKSASTTRVRMVRDDEKDYVFDNQTGSVIAMHDERRRYSSLASLLASEEFINIRSFRATQRRMLAGRQIETYLEPEGQIFIGDTQSTKLNLQSFKDTTNKISSEDLIIVLLDGPAGIGKTSLIERMVYERSDPASLQPPLLHVTSGGSRLTDLAKALAHATQVLRSRITFDQVPILARLGVLQIAIDGFDELVDPDGYKDAWSALRDFLGEVKRGGPIILAGRDTFFDQQGFEKRLADRVPNLQLRHARLMAVSQSAAHKYLSQHGWNNTELIYARDAGWFRQGSYQLRPFFLREMGRNGDQGWNALQQSHGSPQAFLVHQFVEREAKIVSQLVNISLENAEKALWDFYGTIVQDMSIHEVDSVDDGFLGLACEAAFEGYVTADELGKLAHKAGSFGLLESNGNDHMRRFPHSEIQNQFLAKVTIDTLGSSAAISSYLRRAVVSGGLAEAFGDRFDSLPLSEALAVHNQLHRFLIEDMFGERLTANSVALLLATLNRSGIPTLQLNDMTTNEVRLLGKTEVAILKDVSFAHIDARGADCRSISFTNCTVSILTVDEETYFGSSYPKVTGVIQVDKSGYVQALRSPADQSIWFDLHSTPEGISDADYNLPLMQYFERLCRRFSRQHQIRAHSEDEGYFMTTHEYWEEIRKLLGDRIQEVVRDASEPRNIFYRMSQPESFFTTAEIDAETRLLKMTVVERARQLKRI